MTKALLPLLSQADRAILIDNVAVPVECSMLCSVLTSRGEFTTRILGVSENVTLLNKTVFWVTGNNLMIVGDLTRRGLQITLDANVERPEDRRFEFDPVQRAQEMHPELAIAGLTALRAYILAGKPSVSNRALLGSFEDWDRLVCGCLMWCGYGDPLDTKDRVIDNDPQREANLEMLEEWYQTYKSRVVTVSDLMASTNSRLTELLNWGISTPNSEKLIGQRLGGVKNRIIGG